MGLTIDLSGIRKHVNCADKIKAGSNVLVIMCHSTGAVSIYRRYPFDFMVNVHDPLVQYTGKILEDDSLSGL